HGLAVVGQCTAGITAVGTGGHAEGGVTGSTVGDGGNQVGWQAALAFEQHVAPAATGATGRGCEGIEGSSGKQRANQDPFHDYHPDFMERSMNPATPFDNCTLLHSGTDAVLTAY